jgi:hypothetical protein
MAFFWHLRVFASYYDALAIYRPDKIIPFGFLAVLTQGTIFSLCYGRLFVNRSAVAGAANFAVLAGLLSWTFTTLAVSAKHPMTSVSGFVLIETGFTLLQFITVGPLMALAWRSPSRTAREANHDRVPAAR